jgi:hypothetical protein
MTTTLESTFQNLQALGFPEAGESDDLADWIAELSEFDGHVAGIATTIMADGNADTSKLKDEAVKLRLRLIQITDIPNEDREGFENCKKYFFALEEVIENLVT